MSDNIPFDIQMEIINMVSDVKSLVRFRSVSKPWKSFIDNSEFIKGYGARHTHPHCHILSYNTGCFPSNDADYIFVVEDDIETLKVQNQKLVPFVMSPLLKQYTQSYVVGASHGLICWNGYSNKVNEKELFVIWNPSIRKSFGIVAPVPKYSASFKFWHHRVYGFGVCPGTNDPTVIRIMRYSSKSIPWGVEVFTLSSGVWNVIPSGFLCRQSVEFTESAQVVIGRFIYWSARNNETKRSMVVSFDIITKEFNVVLLPNSLSRNKFSVSKLRESLVVSGYISVSGDIQWGVWVMEHNSSFTKLFTMDGQVSKKLVGFKKNGESIIQEYNGLTSTLGVYDPCSQQIKNLGISQEPMRSFFMRSYEESLLLLDHSDLLIYCEDS